MEHKFFSSTNDLVFKKVFDDLNHKPAIKSFLSAILDLDSSEYDVLSVENPFFRIECNTEEKIGILDVKLKTKTGKIIDIEMQVASAENMPERVLYYMSKMVLGQVGKGENYRKIQKVICIVIAADHILVKSNDKMHNKFLLHDAMTDATFTDKMEVNTLELLKDKNDAESSKELKEWVKFFNAKSEKELENLIEKSKDEGIKLASEVVIDVNQDEELRIRAEQRENVMMAYMVDMVGNFDKGKAEGKAEGIEEQKGKEKREIAINLLQMGIEVAQISKATNLSIKEIEALKSVI
jgi:predicted transposase/invertase (TIGR01784 family)